MTYQTQRNIAIGVSFTIAALTFIDGQDHVAHGISPLVATWIATTLGVLGIAAGFLPTVHGRSLDPRFLADRISELPKVDQERVAQILVEREEKVVPHG